MTDETSSPLSDLAASVGGYGVTRRRLLSGAAAMSLVAVMAGEHRETGRLIARLAGDERPDTAVPTPTPSYTFSIARDSDLALLDLAFYGFTLTTVMFLGSETPALQANTNASLITVKFPPQAIGEAAYTYSPPQKWNVDPPPVFSGVSGSSLLAFGFNNGQTAALLSTPMLASDLLDWSDWELLVPSAKAPLDPRDLQVPDGTSYPATYTSYIEYPWGMFLTPPKSQGSTTFIGPPQPLVSSAGVSDLWTAGLYNAVSTDETPQVAAVWALDYGTTESATPESYISYKKSG